jgi:hypothetical protein
MPTKSELKVLSRRISKLREFLEMTKHALANASGQELHVAVAVASRIMNQISRVFDVGLAEDPTAAYEINRSLVRLVRDDKAGLQDVRQRLLEVYDRMLGALAKKANGLAKAETAV